MNITTNTISVEIDNNRVLSDADLDMVHGGFGAVVKTAIKWAIGAISVGIAAGTKEGCEKGCGKVGDAVGDRAAGVIKPTPKPDAGAPDAPAK